MSKIYILADSKALRIFIRENCRTGRFGLAHSIGCPGIIQEDVVDAAGVPGIHTVGASEARVADQGVTATIVVSSIVMRSVVVLLLTALV